MFQPVRVRFCCSSNSASSVRLVAGMDISLGLSLTLEPAIKSAAVPQELGRLESKNQQLYMCPPQRRTCPVPNSCPFLSYPDVFRSRLQRAD